jgi:DNA-binding MarR family transcriptional regulator
VKSLRTLLRSRLEWIEDHLMKNAEKNGYGYVTPSMARLYSYLGETPVPMSELARRLQISRQAVHQLVAEGLNSKFLEVINSPDDKRIKLVKFSTNGKEMSDIALAEIHQAEQELAKHLGEDNIKQLRRILELPWPEN